MNRIDGATLFCLNIVLVVALAAMIWGPTAIVVAGLAGTPLMLAIIVMLARPRRI